MVEHEHTAHHEPGTLAFSIDCDGDVFAQIEFDHEPSDAEIQQFFVDEMAKHMDAEHVTPRRTIEVERGPSGKLGSCNGCNAMGTVNKVKLTPEGGGMEIRFCDECLFTIEAEVRKRRTERPQRV